jgi:glucose/arabinose dehydrogenase
VVPLLCLLVLSLILSGCARGPHVLPLEEQQTIDRSLIEYPAGFNLKPYVDNLNAPTAIAFDTFGTLFVAEGGLDGDEPHIFALRPDGTQFNIFPVGRRVPFVKSGFRIYGPVGGMVVADGHIYVSHRDEHDLGVITAFDYKGNHHTVVADLPARGDYGVTDLAINPINGRLYFGVGTATNSGVVGIDNFQSGWVQHHPKFCDQSYVDLVSHGPRFDTPNPFAGLFGGKDVAVTAPFQPFGVSNQIRIAKSRNGKPNGAIYSIDPGGGDLRVEAYGVHNPRGIQFNAYNRLYMTNTGMELRGTRPVKDDPDVLLWVVRDTWYGWPDYSADLQPISDARFQPPVTMIIKSGYPALSALIDQDASGLLRPDRNTLLAAVFQPLAGAAKFDFAPTTAPWTAFRDSALIALSGDRAPFATGGSQGLKLAGPVGYKVVRVNMDNHEVSDFIHNTRDLPGHELEPFNSLALERPIDVKYNPVDNCLYILDFGRMRMRGGKEEVKRETGKIYRLVPVKK